MLPCIGSLVAYLCRKMKTTMTKKQRQELVRLEKQIVKTARYVEGHGLVEPMSAWDGTTREEVAVKPVGSDILERLVDLVSEPVGRSAY